MIDSDAPLRTVSVCRQGLLNDSAAYNQMEHDVVLNQATVTKFQLLNLEYQAYDVHNMTLVLKAHT